MKKLLALLVALAMIVSLVACGNANTPAATDAPKADAPAKDDAPAEDDAPELEEVTLKFYFPYDYAQTDVETVENAVNEYLKDTLNIKLDILGGDWTTFNEKTSMAIASGEPFDICFTASWANNFYGNVSKNAFMPLDDLLNEYGQDLLATKSPAAFEAAKVGGSIYAIPNNDNWYQPYITVATEWLDKYDFDLSTVKTYADLEPLLEAIKADNPDMIPYSNTAGDGFGNTGFIFGFEWMIGPGYPYGISIENEDFKVINPYELPEMVEYFKLMREWNQKGYCRADAATYTDSQLDILNGSCVACFGSTYDPTYDTSPAAQTKWGTEITSVPVIETPIQTTSCYVAMMTAISKTSENPERAMMFLNQLNTDPVLYNLIVLGVEGTHYTKAEDGTITQIEGSGYTPTNLDWVVGNTLLSYASDAEMNKVKQDMCASAKAVPACGFAFDTTNVATEIASVSAVIDEFAATLWSGAAEDVEGTLDEFMAKLEAAGSEVIRAEMQAQLDAWVAANK